MTRYLTTSAAVASLAVLFACSQQTSNAQEEAATPPPEPTEAQDQIPDDAGMDGPKSIPSMMRATGDLMGVDGNTIGSVNLIEGPNGIAMNVSIEEGSLEPGWHAIHLHQTGDCSDTGEYKASGGHIGKIEGGHGLLNPDGPEKGDLPNLYVAADGSVEYETFTNLVAMSDILDDDGSAAIIHEGRDDHMSQPIGGAGARVACAVIE
ncbi:superoxide dismutase family protein [Henriciella litoralis]|uniref:superoxide dismutase family protein n=1 Tax=Henriciella litoralis TaxID=568102 RepID=UPI001F47C5E2|nr:superoxide dismutase family protein [Henriciella litoralis]